MQTATKTATLWTASELMGVVEAAQYLGVSRITVYAMMKRGDLPYLQIGGSRAIPLTELRAYRERRQSIGTIRG
jgi:excisionase family DNA binding protein